MEKQVKSENKNFIKKNSHVYESRMVSSFIFGCTIVERILSGHKILKGKEVREHAMDNIDIAL